MTEINKSTGIPLRADAEFDGRISAGADIRRALVADLRECPHSRAEIAVRLSAECGRAISESAIDAYAAESKQGHRLPAEMVAAWVKVTGSTRLLTLLCEGSGFHLATATDMEFAELGREGLRRKKQDQRMAELEGGLWREV